MAVAAVDPLSGANCHSCGVLDEFGLISYTARRGYIEGGDPMQQEWTALISQDEGSWVGWIAEIPGVIAQERTKPELLESLTIALREAIEMNREDAMAQAGNCEKVAVAL